MDDSHRVRTLIPHLVFGELRKAKALPKETIFPPSQIPKGGSFPPLAKKMGYSPFGLLMEKVIEGALTDRSRSDVDVLNYIQPGVPGEMEQYHKPESYTSVIELVRNHFSAGVHIEYEPEWYSERVVGHPDLVSGDCVYDIKTSGRFGAMRTATILQILSYYCLAQKRFPGQITKIGLVLPAQNLILVHSLEGWNWELFWEELKGCISLQSKQIQSYSAPMGEIAMFTSMMRSVGAHIGKEKLLVQLQETPHVPLQFFVAGRCSGNVVLAQSFQAKLRTAIEVGNCRVFIHSPYVLNLSKPYGNRPREGDGDCIVEGGWVCEKLASLLQMGAMCRIRGIVVHCGKKGTMKIEDAVSEMRKTVEIVSNYATERCALLIETSSGQGGEILCSPEELSDFWLSLSDNARKVVGICVDTCHVFAAGYDPYEYIMTLEERRVPVCLVHYNESKMPKGSKRDRHAPIGHGHIGFQSLFKVLSWANSVHVPCVRE